MLTALFFFLYNMLYLWDSEGVGVWGNKMRKGLGKRIVESSGLDETKKFKILNSIVL